MPKMLIVIMEDQYPFENNNHSQVTNQESIMVRQTIPIKQNDRSQTLAKATFVKNLKNKNIVKIESILQQQNSLHILYQYIETKNQWNKYNNIVVQIYQQLLSLTNYLTNIGVKAQIKQGKIGVTQHNYVKYFLGLDFVWDTSDDQTQLVQFYQNELMNIFGERLGMRQRQVPRTRECMPYGNWPQSQIQQQDCHGRKVSFATLPSQYNRFLKIDQQLNIMKSCAKQVIPKPNIIKTSMRSQSSQQTSIMRSIQKPHNILTKINKKYENRKYSGDLKFTMFSNKKLFEKESDIKSQRGFRLAVNKFQQRRVQESNPQEIQTINSKSRIQEMKHQEYMQITKSNKQYLQDFMSVLEDDEPDTATIGFQSTCKSIGYETQDKSYENYGRNKNINNDNSNNNSPNHKNNNTNSRINTSQISRQNNTEQLQKRARQAIQNSIKAIKKFKNIPS